MFVVGLAVNLDKGFTRIVSSFLRNRTDFEGERLNCSCWVKCLALSREHTFRLALRYHLIELLIMHIHNIQ